VDETECKDKTALYVNVLAASGQNRLFSSNLPLSASELLLLLCRLENLERAQQALVDTHHGTGIVKLSTVVGSTEQCDELAF